MKPKVTLCVGGVEKPLVEWVRGSGINRTTLEERLKRGWTAEQAVLTPIRRKKK